MQPSALFIGDMFDCYIILQGLITHCDYVRLHCSPDDIKATLARKRINMKVITNKGKFYSVGPNKEPSLIMDLNICLFCGLRSEILERIMQVSNTGMLNGYIVNLLTEPDPYYLGLTERMLNMAGIDRPLITEEPDLATCIEDLGANVNDISRCIKKYMEADPELTTKLNSIDRKRRAFKKMMAGCETMKAATTETVINPE
ncbi:MAG TPA: hypothetical protein VJ552_07965 [Sediminibacterium sp.]|nr:hypothetical protein [Sediminibacterium sp.]